MSNLTKEEKLLFVLEKQKEEGFSAHFISKNTGLSEAGVQRILNGSSKSPQEKSLNLIIEFLEGKQTGKSTDTKSIAKSKDLDYIDIQSTVEMQREIISLYRELKELRSKLSECEQSKK
jgi:transcriptional regulator with XRE-family HTH domain